MRSAVVNSVARTIATSKTDLNVRNGALEPGRDYQSHKPLHKKIRLRSLLEGRASKRFCSATESVINDHRFVIGAAAKSGAPRDATSGTRHAAASDPLEARRSAGRHATRTINFPKFFPSSNPMNASGACSSPSTMSSRSLTRPSRTHAFISSKNSGNRAP
jgi:hypothetical protein